MTLSDWYKLVKLHPCLRCGVRGESEAAHVQGFPSEKVKGQMLPRSHQTIAAWCCIPLCPACHRTSEDSIHSAKEGEWLDKFIAGGRVTAIGWVARELAMCLTQDL